MSNETTVDPENISYLITSSLFTLDGMLTAATAIRPVDRTDSDPSTPCIAVLDVGCGPDAYGALLISEAFHDPSMLPFLHSRRPEVVAIDPALDLEAFERLQEDDEEDNGDQGPDDEIDEGDEFDDTSNLHLAAVRLEDMPAPQLDASAPTSFDLIIFNHSLEYMDDPVGAIQQCLSELAVKETVFFIACPNGAIVEGAKDWAMTEGRKHRFTLDSLRRALNSLGLHEMLDAQGKPLSRDDIQYEEGHLEIASLWKARA